MELFIQIREGQPYEHPISGDNFKQAFPEVDTGNLPESFARFVRVEQPVVDVYEVYEGVTYEWVNDVVTDVHHVRPMTNDEKLTHQNKVKSLWVENGYPSWVFDDVNCLFKPPVEYPTDGKSYKWDESLVAWVENA